MKSGLRVHNNPPLFLPFGKVHLEILEIALCNILILSKLSKHQMVLAVRAA